MFNQIENVYFEFIWIANSFFRKNIRFYFAHHGNRDENSGC